MSKYTITAPNGESITVVARAYRQNIWNKARLVGVSATGKKRLEKFLSSNCEWSSKFGFYANTHVDATNHMPLFEGVAD
ncbi:MAG: hypothetical protein IT466_08770 [Moraxellaceae bacterium]|nr:hypothetical protein [Moraxellaceae bacterium]